MASLSDHQAAFLTGQLGIVPAPREGRDDDGATGMPLAQRGLFSRFSGRKGKGKGRDEAAPSPADKGLQDKLKTLNDAIAALGKSGFNTAQGKADAKGTEDDGVYAYERNGKLASANSFNVTTLHEIGHAVDTRNGIMNAADQNGAGFGGWKSVGLEGVVTAELAELKKAATLRPKVTDELLKAALRTGTRVNNDQWRSPAECFAEVYAITWLKKAKPPSAIDAKVAKYCWNGRGEPTHVAG